MSFVQAKTRRRGKERRAPFPAETFGKLSKDPSQESQQRAVSILPRDSIEDQQEEPVGYPQEIEIYHNTGNLIVAEVCRMTESKMLYVANVLKVLPCIGTATFIIIPPTDTECLECGYVYHYFQFAQTISAVYHIYNQAKHGISSARIQHTWSLKNSYSLQELRVATIKLHEQTLHDILHCRY